MSLAFAALGLLTSIACWKAFRSVGVFLGCFWFFLMELLQYFQYQWIDQCDSPINKWLTIVGFVHICYQPFFQQCIYYGFAKSKEVVAKYDLVLKLCLVSGTYLLFRVVGGILFPEWIKANQEGFGLGQNADGTLVGHNSTCGRSPEWLRSNQLCTFSGRYHLGWGAPMLDQSYYMPGVFIHFFFMFIPSLVIRHDRVYPWVATIVLMLTGPVLSAFITDDLMEQASIWCFFSVAQMVILFLGATRDLYKSEGALDGSNPKAAQKVVKATVR